jgi:hypothetical protein
MLFPKLIPLALVLGALALPACSDKEQEAVAPAAAVSQNAAGSNTLSPGESLQEGQALVSSDGRFRLEVQYDRNLVIYQAGQGAIWASNTQLGPNEYRTWASKYRLDMQGDGNLVLYELDYSNSIIYGTIWSTGTYNQPGAYLTMQNDGNLVIYRNGAPTWQSQTGGR